MTVIFEQRYARTLDNLPAEATHVWLFEPYQARLEKMREAARDGHHVVIHSAYKTLLHEVIEQQLLVDVDEVEIHYPVVEGDEPARFRLECYPLTSLYDHCRIKFIAKPCGKHDSVSYDIIYADGHKISVFVPVKWRQSADNCELLVACGWQMNAKGQGQPYQTEFEKIFDDVCQQLVDWPITPRDNTSASGPFFRQLQAKITLPAQDVALPIGEESISFAEALHEDLYFSALEIFQYRLGLPAGDRTLTPGQFLPVIQSGGQPSLTLVEYDGQADIDMPAQIAELSSVGHWLNPSDIAAHLKRIGGEPFAMTSRQNRQTLGTVVRHHNPVKIAISSGQHANESSGIVGALRAGYALVERGDTDFTLRPLGNPDGYAAFRYLCQYFPRHMHHAARYTASGCDLAYGDSHETKLCHLAKEHLDAMVHLNLHGYPAHEWTRPLSGYVPRGFARWTIPKGYFIICRYRPDQKSFARELTQAAIEAIRHYSAQFAQNKRMLNRYLDTVGQADFDIAYDAIPFVLEMSEALDYPVEIITEAPDETVYGESFRIAHESHYRVVLSVVEALHQYVHQQKDG